MKESWLDTNVVLRYLLADHTDQSPRAKALFEQAEAGQHTLKIAPHIVCEIVYILQAAEISRERICASLRQLCRLKGVAFDQEAVILDSLAEYQETNVDFADALLAAIARARGERVWTFNAKHFKRMSLLWEEPPSRREERADPAEE